jgi:hypothetical protein
MSRRTRQTENPTRTWFKDVARQWNQFWFTPLAPHTLGMIRILAGAMLLYTHLVWTIGLEDFFGANAWLDRETTRNLSGQYYAWSPLFHFDNPLALWLFHLASIATMFGLMVGWRTRETSILAWLFAVSYCHRLQGALFGLDQVNTMLAMYLMLAPCGAVYSVDRWLAGDKGSEEPTVSTNIATRLMQLHLCVVYLFGSVTKMRGDSWWDGSAFWFGIANLEYQSLDLTWMVRFPALIAFVTHATLFWELFYCGLIWPKRTRPLMLAFAVVLHTGIAMCMGMITFGLAMIFFNSVFVPPAVTQRWVARWTRRG